VVAICVSYNYFDTLQYTLPANYLHFEKIYLVTQKDDTDTVDFCKKFDNVCLLFYDFNKNGKKFDKYGAIHYAQQIAYQEYPKSWYLNIDSDILLPNNFVAILQEEKLDEKCIYGATRNNVLKISGLLNKTSIINDIRNLTYINNHILYIKNSPPSILGCFQLYKKKVLQKTTYNDASVGDHEFGYENFDMFCNLENLLYFHLGKDGINWQGKVISFIRDVDISPNQMYYHFHKKTPNIYYNKQRHIVRYGDSKNIHDDIWTCSDQMRLDIATFFENKPEYQIAEIGSHKGYTTRLLSNLFTRVYAVDNNAEWMKFNQNYNADATNIEYVMLDIYKENWDKLPNYIEVVFIDAVHSYECCKSDVVNSIRRFQNLQYIIFDDYGVWDGVKTLVDELLQNQDLILEQYIGETNVPGPDGMVTNCKEGLICRVNHRIRNSFEKSADINDIHVTEETNEAMIQNIQTLYNWILGLTIVISVVIVLFIAMVIVGMVFVKNKPSFAASGKTVFCIPIELPATFLT
jgi:hypothetical protein